MTTPAAKKTTMKAAETLTTKQIAEALGTDPKTLRVFLRASDDYEAVGAGSRYSFTTKDVGPMKTRFMKWTKEREATKAAKKAEAEAAKATDEPTPDAE
ncbi:hypothetical protein AB0H49_32105 [Nocardia sp. NPDC050713]|uniref:hypothetical protein n=1 Tax=Nocardia sp. NPDC050713 TaxID=3154511 RepID=UPI0033E6F0F5